MPRVVKKASIRTLEDREAARYSIITRTAIQLHSEFLAHSSYWLPIESARRAVEAGKALADELVEEGII